MKCNLTGTCENPALGLWLLRMAVAFLFLFPGIMKLMNPEMIIGMVQNTVGLPGTLGVITAWVLITTEVLGGIFVLLGRIVPQILYKLSLIGFFIILLVAMGTVHIPSKDPIAILSTLLMIASVLCLFLTRTMCPIGLTGEKN